MVSLLYLHDLQQNTPQRAAAANLANIDLISDLKQHLSQEKAKTIITLDDGYQSAQRIIPILEEYEVECILFITTGFADRQIFPYEVTLSNFFEANEAFTNFDKKRLSISTKQEKALEFSLLHKKFKFKNSTSRQEMLTIFFALNNTTPDQFESPSFLTWQEIKKLSDHPLVEIGSHTSSHLHLPSQPWKTIYSELKASKKRLEEALSKPVNKVSYPYGGYDIRTLLLARLAGYKQGYITQGNPRVRTQLNITRQELAVHLSGGQNA